MVIFYVPSLCKKARYCYNFGAKHMYAHSNNSPKNYEVCDRMATQLLASSLRVSFLTYFSMILNAGAPMHKTLFTDENEWMVPVIVPFTDPDTRNGFLINMGYQLLIAGAGLLVVPGSELVSCVMKNNVSVIAAVVENGLTEFNERLRKDKRFFVKHNNQYRNLIVQIVDFNRFELVFILLKLKSVNCIKS